MLILTESQLADDTRNTLRLDNDLDPSTVNLEGVERIELQFPKFTDGRAYSQALLLRRRYGYTGEIRARGDVLVDQLVQMQRCGFDAAVLRADQDAEVGRAQFQRFAAFYQGDLQQPRPLFARAGVPA